MLQQRKNVNSFSHLQCLNKIIQVNYLVKRKISPSIIFLSSKALKDSLNFSTVASPSLTQAVRLVARLPSPLPIPL